MQIADHLKSLEEKLLDSTTRHNSDLVSSLLADDFLEFGSSGRIFDKAAILEELRNEPSRTTPRLSDFAVRPLAADTTHVFNPVLRRDEAVLPIRSERRLRKIGRASGRERV